MLPAWVQCLCLLGRSPHYGVRDAVIVRARLQLESCPLKRSSTPKPADRRPAAVAARRSVALRAAGLLFVHLARAQTLAHAAEGSCNAFARARARFDVCIKLIESRTCVPTYVCDLRGAVEAHERCLGGVKRTHSECPSRCGLSRENRVKKR